MGLIHKLLCRSWFDQVRRRGLGEHKIVNEQGVDSRTEIAASRISRCYDQRLTKQVEGGVDQHRSLGLFPERLEQPPEQRVTLLLHHVQAYLTAGQEKAFREAERTGLHCTQRIHELALLRGLEVARAVFLGNRYGKGTKPLAMLNEVVEVFP